MVARAQEVIGRQTEMGVGTHGQFAKNLPMEDIHEIPVVYLVNCI